MLYYKEEQGGRDTSDEMSKLRRGFQGAVLRLLRHGAEQEGAEGEKKAGSSEAQMDRREHDRWGCRDPVLPGADSLAIPSSDRRGNI